MRRSLKATLALLAGAILASPVVSSAQTRTPGERLAVREHTLDNGLRLLILPRGGAPTVSFVVRRTSERS